MFVLGPKRTSLVAPHMSAFGGNADMTFAAHMSAYDPKRTLLRGAVALFREIAARKPIKCEIAHAPLQRNSLKLICLGHGQGTANGKREPELPRVLDVIEGDTRTIH
jgi:hypothetical protein